MKGSASEKRNSAIPDVPTYGEMGFPGVYSGSWVAFFAPAKTPDAIVARLQGAIRAAAVEPELKAKMAELGAETVGSTPADIAFVQNTSFGLSLVANGLETQERINSWREMFKHYVPLKRDPNELDFVNPSFGMGKGFAIRGDFSRTATGSLKTVVDILNNIALQREMAIVRSEKARVGRALYGMALQAPNPEFWMPINPDAIKNKKKLIAELKAMGLDPADAENILQEPRTPRIDKKTGMVEYAVNPAMRNMPNVFPVRINGKDRFIIFNPADKRAMRIRVNCCRVNQSPWQTGWRNLPGHRSKYMPK